MQLFNAVPCSPKSVTRPVALVFAELLLDNPDKWNSDSIQKLLDSEKPQNVFLEDPLTVMLLYGTVSATDMELVRFYNDIYERDARVLNSLNAAFVFRDALAGSTGDTR